MSLSDSSVPQQNIVPAYIYSPIPLDRGGLVTVVPERALSFPRSEQGCGRALTDLAAKMAGSEFDSKQHQYTLCTSTAGSLSYYCINQGPIHVDNYPIHTIAGSRGEALNIDSVADFKIKFLNF